MMRYRKLSWIAAAAVMTTGVLCLSGTGLGAVNEQTSLQDRVEQLERQLAEITRETSQTVETGPVPAPKETPARKSVWSNLDVQLYGFIKGDLSYDTSRTFPGNFVLYVDREDLRKNDDEFNLTANASRLGLNFAGPPSDTMKISGKIEVDFFGTQAHENRAKPQMRHAYVSLFWPEWNLDLLAGQTWDVISPLNPGTLDYPVLWGSGNIGYRRPQVRLTKGVPLAEGASLKLEGAVARTIGRADAIESETGEAAGFPTLQGRAGLTFPFLGPAPTVIGVSGHYGREKYYIDQAGTHETLKTWSINLDVTQPVLKWLVLRGELFKGENLDSYLGGILQGVNTATVEEIGSQGGWVAVTLGPWSKWAFNIGAGVDRVDGDDVGEGARTRNSSVFGNAIYSLNKHVQIGAELSHRQTRYKGPGDADAVRIQAAFTYTF